MRFYLNILVWNDLRNLPDLIGSIKAQTYQDWVVRILDNGSTDGSFEYLQKHVSSWLVAHNPRNAGTAVGHNQLAKAFLAHEASRLKESMVIVTSAKVILSQDFLLNLSRIWEINPDVAVIQPKVFQAVPSAPDEPERSVRTDILISTGLIWPKNWRLYDRGSGEMDNGQYDGAIDLVGPSGIVFALKAEVLLDLMVEEELYFKEFFSSKQDRDLAIRLKRLGYLTRFAPTVTAYYSGEFDDSRAGWWQEWKNRKMKRPMARAIDLKDQLLFLLSNLTLGDGLRFGRRILGRELPRIIIGVVFEPMMRRELLQLGKVWWDVLRKKNIVMSRARLSPASLRSYVVCL